METYTKDEIIAVNSLMDLNNSLVLDQNLYHSNLEIRNYYRTHFAIKISNYYKLINSNYDCTFFEKIINAFKYFQSILPNNEKRILPDFLTIFWNILIKQERNGLILTDYIISIMKYDFEVQNKTIKEIEIEDKIINLYK
jgi:hypothetical protein